MPARRKVSVAMLAAVVLLGALVQSSSARNLSIQEREKGFRIVWTAFTFEAAGAAVRCPVTLDGAFSVSSFAKRAGTSIGSIQRALIRGSRANGECTGGEATLLGGTLPWEVNYGGFGGTLPAISSLTLRIVGLASQVHYDALATTCLSTTTTAQVAQGIATVDAGGHVTSFRWDERAGIETRGGLYCGFSLMGLVGTGTVTGLEGGAGVTFRLI